MFHDEDDPEGLIESGDVHCHGCERSVIGRFGNAPLEEECESCKRDFEHYMEAGKIADGEGWCLEVVKIGSLSN